MTDPNLAEQAEREIADQLGFHIKQGLQPNFPQLWGKLKPKDADKGHWSASKDEIALWQALVRDRCSLLKLRKAAEQLEVQLAGCSVAALGWSRGEQKANPGDYGYSASYQDVMDLREKYEALRKIIGPMTVD